MREIGYFGYGKWWFLSIGLEKVCQIHGQELVTYFILFIYLFTIYLLVGKAIIDDVCMFTYV